MPAHTRRLTPKDVLGMPLLHSDPQIDPSGACIAYVRAEIAREKSKLVKRNIWIVNTDGTRERKFTCGPRADFHPRWSPDGARLAFLSDRLEDGKLQLYCMDRDGGEAQALTVVQGEIEASTGRSALQWSPDGRFLSFLMRDPETAQEKRRIEEKDDACVHEEPRASRDVWRVDLPRTGKSRLAMRQLTRTLPNVRDFALGEQELIHWQAPGGRGR